MFVSNPLNTSESKPIEYGNVRLAGSSLCSDAGEDVVSKADVVSGRDEVLKVGELTDTGTDSVSRSALDIHIHRDTQVRGLINRCQWVADTETYGHTPPLPLNCHCQCSPAALWRRSGRRPWAPGSRGTGPEGRRA